MTSASRNANGEGKHYYHDQQAGTHQHYAPATPSPAPVGSTTAEPSHNAPFRILGIGLVVEEAGRGSRLVFRYPASPPSWGPAALVEGREGSYGGNRRSSDDSTAINGRTTASPSNDGGVANSGGGNTKGASPERTSCDLFFNLPPRVMAKLFRPKWPLCGQPMTLSIGGTVFCCRAVLIHPDNCGGGELPNDSPIKEENALGGGQPQTNPKDGRCDGTASSSSLVLFSVIVALAPSVPIAGDWFDGTAGGGMGLRRHLDSSSSFLAQHHQNQKQQNHHHPSLRRHGSTSSTLNGAHAGGGGSQSTASFRSIRRVHLSLGRLCRVLEREEERVRYVSRESARLIRIRTEEKRRSSAGGGAGGGGGSTDRSGARVGSGGSSSTTPAVSPVDARQGSLDGSRTDGTDGGGGGGGAGGGVEGEEEELENRQRLIELMLSSADGEEEEGRGGRYGMAEENMEGGAAAATVVASSSGLSVVDGSSGAALRGNLAWDLARTFHSLSRNDRPFLPTPTSLLSGREGIVYVNRHIAVSIEAVGECTSAGGAVTASPQFRLHSPRRGPPLHSSSSASSMTRSSATYDAIRPYHTLLFPHAPPSDLLRTLSSSSSAASPPQQLQHLLLMANPRKPLSDIAVDAALPLPMALELASHLVASGTCVISPVITRMSKFACCGVDGDGGVGGSIRAMQRQALPFARRFGPWVPIFLAVSALTESTSSSHHPSDGGGGGGATTALGDAMAAAVTEGSLVGDRIASSLRGRVGGLATDGGVGGVSDQKRPRGGSLGADPTTASKATVGGGGGGGGPHVGGGAAVGEQVGLLPSVARTGVVPRVHPPVLGVVSPPQPDAVQDVLYSMAVWLRSRSVIIEMKEYMVWIGAGMVSIPSDAGLAAPVSTAPEKGGGGPAAATGGGASASTSAPTGDNIDTNVKWDRRRDGWHYPTSSSSYDGPREDGKPSASVPLSERPAGGASPSALVSPEEALYQELLEAGCLAGNVSTVALCWKMGLDMRRLKRFRDWAVRERRIEVVTRIPIPGDDWGAP